MVILIGLYLFIIVCGLLENYLHQRRLKSIPIRIHINGTRGKSTVTRLVAAGLREAGYSVLAKTTGSAARLILEDGSETPVRRRGRPNIFEQVRTVTMASRRGNQALVVECMAIHPETQWVSEHILIKSTIGVITNVRADHLDVMGPTLQDVALALANTVPRCGQVITTDKSFLPLLQQVTSKRKTILHTVSGDDVAGIMSYRLPEHFRDNLAGALKVCELLGISQEVALRGMGTMRADPGALKIFKLFSKGKWVYFINAFAANDLISTRLILNQCKMLPELTDLACIALMNR